MEACQTSIEALAGGKKINHQLKMKEKKRQKSKNKYTKVGEERRNSRTEADDDSGREEEEEEEEEGDPTSINHSGRGKNGEHIEGI